jgi:hypothetical protein
MEGVRVKKILVSGGTRQMGYHLVAELLRYDKTEIAWGV